MTTIRDCTRADLPAVVRLLADDPLGATREDTSQPPAKCYVDAFEAMTAQTGNRVLLAVDGDEILGCLQLTVIPGLSRRGTLRGQIEGVRVAGTARNRGIGALLLEAAIEQARAAGCGLVQLTTDRRRADAHRFYERHGFVATHSGMKRELDR